MLLVDHKNAGLWLPPGGHVEMGEHPRSTVARELREELGIRANHEIHSPLMVTCTTTVGLAAGHTDVSLWYVVHADCTHALNVDHAEFESVKWFGFADLPFERSDPHLRRFVQKLSRPQITSACSRQRPARSSTLARGHSSSPEPT
jgi:8-oxo-dGTP pyrophosphatase MutT (NUDIX family)